MVGPGQRPGAEGRAPPSPPGLLGHVQRCLGHLSAVTVSQLRGLLVGCSVERSWACICLTSSSARHRDRGCWEESQRRKRSARRVALRAPAIGVVPEDAVKVKEGSSGKRSGDAAREAARSGQQETVPSTWPGQAPPSGTPAALQRLCLGRAFPAPPFRCQRTLFLVLHTRRGSRLLVPNCNFSAILE